jgi:hypothetical protein
MRPPDDEGITRWYKQFRDTGSVKKGHSTGLPGRSDEDVGHVGQA